MPHFYCLVQDKVEGPFDLIELAGLLKNSGIEVSTLVCREGEETWTAFCDLPEFTTAQAMSIEEIARHLEAKKYVPDSIPWFRKIHPAIWGIVGVAIAWASIAGFQAIFPEKLTKTDWLETKEDHFSVRCPVPLRLVMQEPGEKEIRYRGFYQGKTNTSSFGVDERVSPDANAFPRGQAQVVDAVDMNDMLLIEMEEAYLDKIHAHVVSNKGFKEENGRYNIRDVLFTIPKEGMVANGGLRYVMIVDKDREDKDKATMQIYLVSVLADPNDFSSKDVQSVLSSFKVH